MRERLLLTLVLLALASCGSTQGKEGSGCFPNNTCSKDSTGAWLLCQDGVCVKPACSQGEVGCGCFPGGTCAEGLYCGSSTGAPRCELPNCNVGDVNCGCRPDRTCNAGPDGRALVCEGRICVAATCAQGDANCACREDYGCNRGLVCSSVGKCVAPACNAGELGCGCLPTGTCNGATLFCAADGKCQAQTCNQGEEGCGCRSDFTCSPGANNSVLVCVTGKCVKRSCTTAGQVDCPCRTDGTCAQGATCRNGVCVTAESLIPPASPRCFSPCQTGLTLPSGAFVQCGADGLLAPAGAFDGCLDGKVCRSGSCVADGGTVPACAGEVDCPEFQTCIQGRCYSNCDLDSDCSGARRCFRRVCRASCSAANDSCPTGTVCTMTDATNGFCMPQARTVAGSVQNQVVGSFTLSTDAIAFSSARTSASVTLTNFSPATQEFTVRKFDQVDSFEDGGIIADGGQLFWLTMGASTVASTPAGQFRVLVDTSQLLSDGGVDGGTVQLVFANANGSSLKRWQGRIEVSNPQLGSRTISVSYASVPQGRWAGKMHYFSRFDDVGISNLSQSNNAFLRRWADFRAGTISRASFDSVLTSVLSGSWQFASTRQLCLRTFFPSTPQGSVYCYLTDQNAAGVSLLNDSSTTIPTGVTELPLAFDIQPTPGQPARYTGKIATGESLQYAGNPAVELVFAQDPTACPGNFCTVQSLSAAVVLGGRYIARNDPTCSAAAATGFAPKRIPWLPPDFRGTAISDGGIDWFQTECQSTTVAEATSNPIPDGRSRKRRLELVDGALLDQTRLVLIVKERFEDAFFPPVSTGDTGFVAYGVMILERTPTTLFPTDYVGTVQVDNRPQPATVLDATCPAQILAKIPATATTIAQRIEALINPGPGTGARYGAEDIHYLCEDTGLFDSGPSAVSGVTQQPRLCPVGSRVTFFAASLTNAQIAALPCQLNGTCKVTMNEWEINGRYGFVRDPVYVCAGSNVVLCDTDRYDLRVSKEFYRPGTGGPLMLPFFAALDSAFRYKTRFIGRQGTGLAFTPSICSSTGGGQTRVWLQS
jgi:hypothetical protein